MMNTSEKLLIATMFKLEIYRRKGSAFEDFFIEVLTKFNPNFTPVKPHGTNGDRKNDGFIPDEGIYYQVYAPEDPNNKIVDAVEKLKEDFKGLIKHWGKVSKINEFYFVFNEKYNGPYPKVIAEIFKLQEKYKDIKINLFIAKDLENIFWKLSDDDKVMITKFIPDPSRIEMVDYEALTEVVNFLLTNQKPLDIEKGLQVPDFAEKISFNGLSEITSNLLSSASHQFSALDDYFKANSDFSRDFLQKKFIELYLKGLAEIPDNTENRSDLVFFSILKNASPNNTKYTQDAVLVLMSYFFETCDIFEEPK